MSVDAEAVETDRYKQFVDTASGTRLRKKDELTTKVYPSPLVVGLPIVYQPFRQILNPVIA